LISPLWGFNIIQNSAKDDNREFSIIHLIDDATIRCDKIQKSVDRYMYVCAVDKILLNTLSKKDTKYFSIDFMQDRNRLFVKINPKFNSKIFPITNDLVHEKVVDTNVDTEYAEHWIVVGYESTLPLFDKLDSDKGIDFPVTFSEPEIPHVGALDLSGNPLLLTRNRDLRFYKAIKELYDDHNYRDVLKKSNDAIKKFPTSIFAKEFNLYKLRAMDHLLALSDEEDEEDSEDTNMQIMQLAKKWIKSYTSDNDLPEVMYILTKSLSNLRRDTEFSYYLEILATEHKKSKFAHFATLLYADKLFEKNRKDDAKQLYLDVLKVAKDIDIASIAAIKLADLYLSEGEVGQADKYFKQVLKANKAYFQKDPKKVDKLLDALVRNDMYPMAVKIGEELLGSLQTDHELYEPLLKNLGLWSQKMGDDLKALGYFKRYQEEFEYGEFDALVKEEMDRLLFVTGDQNSSKEMEHLDKLIEKYNGEDIAKKALLRKAELLSEEKKYKEVFALKSQVDAYLEDNETVGIFTKSAHAWSKELLKEDRCQEALELIGAYGIEFESSFDGKLYECSMRLSQYDSAKKIAHAYINDANLKQRLTWMARELKVLVRQKEYKKSIDLARDVLSLAEVLKDNSYNDIYYYLFDAYEGMRDKENMIAVAEKVEKLFPSSAKNSEIFYALALLSSRERNDVAIIKYAKKVIDLEKRYKIRNYGAHVDFLYIDALKRLKKISTALAHVGRVLKYTDLTTKQRDRLLYVAGELHMNSGDNQKAKTMFEQCSKEANSWATLCKDGLNLVGE
jgi:predicted negative regulator of RcsB-dependent stress response